MPFRAHPAPRPRALVGAPGRAFSLVELLVVIGIIALLIAILLPVLGRARMAATRTQSASNLRQLGIALAGYANDHRGRFPEVAHGLPPERSWVYTLARYLGDVDRVRICPADPRADERLRIGGTSYVLNEYVTVPRVDPFGNVLEDFTKLSRIRRSSETVVAFVAADAAPVLTTEDHTHSRGWFDNVPASVNWTKLCRDVQPDRFRTSKRPDHAAGSTLLLYADAHVETVAAADLKRKADANENFAKPPAQ